MVPRLLVRMLARMAIHPVSADLRERDMGVIAKTASHMTEMTEMVAEEVDTAVIGVCSAMVTDKIAAFPLLRGS